MAAALRQGVRFLMAKALGALAHMGGAKPRAHAYNLQSDHVFAVYLIQSDVQMLSFD